MLQARTLLMVVVGIAVDVGLAAGARGLAMPLPLDSLGTILVGVTCGPLAGALTGTLAALVGGTSLAPLGVSTSPTFALVGATTGLLAGLLGGAGAWRPRPHARRRVLLGGLLLLAVVVVVLGWYGWQHLARFQGVALLTASTDGGAVVALGWAAAFVVVAAVVAGIGRFVLLRDAAIPVVVLAGALMGLATGMIRMLLITQVQAGRTGTGMDGLMDALARGGLDVTGAALGVVLLIEPIDRSISGLAVFVGVAALAVATRARFPQGGALIADSDDFALRVGTSMRATRR